jgi:hypothetical protein
MASMRLLFALCLVGVGCKTPATDIGDVTVGSASYHISREGDAVAAGVSTDLVVKPAAGDTKPDSVVGWIGLADAADSTKVTGTFDPNDGDFDNDLTCPSPLPAGSQFWFTVTVAGVPATGSIDYK